MISSDFRVIPGCHYWHLTCHIHSVHSVHTLIYKHSTVYIVYSAWVIFCDIKNGGAVHYTETPVIMKSSVIMLLAQVHSLLSLDHSILDIIIYMDCTELNLRLDVSICTLTSPNSACIGSLYRQELPCIGSLYLCTDKSCHVLDKWRSTVQGRPRSRSSHIL